VATPSGDEKIVCSGIVQVTVSVMGDAFAATSGSTMGLPPVGVKVKTKSNSVGMNVDVLATSWAEMNSPCPLMTTVTASPSQEALISVEFLAFVDPL
jgi:hypothetical protein